MDFTAEHTDGPMSEVGIFTGMSASEHEEHGYDKRIITGANKDLDREEEMHDLGCPSEIKESFETAKEAQRFAEKFACERGFVIV